MKQLSIDYPSIPWFEYFNTILAPVASVTQDEVVIISSPTYMKDLEKLIEETPKRVMANYMFWRISGSSVSYLNEEIRKRQLVYSTVVSGKTEREPRWKECTDITSGSLGLSIGALYVRKYFNEDSKNKALEMVADIRREFTKILNKVPDSFAPKSFLESSFFVVLNKNFVD